MGRNGPSRDVYAKISPPFTTAYPLCQEPLFYCINHRLEGSRTETTTPPLQFIHTTSGLNEPQIFLAKYHLYKKATSTIARWIAETAASIGFDVKTKDQKQQKTKSKSKKGAMGKDKQKATGGSSSTVYQLGVSDFVPMAEAIAKAGEQAESEIMVPVALCRHFSRAIQTRRKVSQWYKARVHGDTKSDLRHEYFIKVLEDTFASLKPFLGTGGLEPARNNVSDTTTSGLSSRNRFAGLTVDELAAVADEEDIAEDTLSEFSGVKF